MRHLRGRDFLLNWENNGKGGKQPYSWLQFCSDLNLTIEEMDKLASQDPELASLVKLYQQKCKASILSALLRDSKNLAKYWELTYARDAQGEREAWEDLSTIK